MVARRSASRAVTVERPRIKGWWGQPEAEELEPEVDERAASREPLGRRAARPEHAIAQVGRALTPSQIEAIRTVMRLFVDDDTARGVDPRCTLVCQRCAGPRPAIGSVRYERYTFCHECSIEYEIVRARGLIEAPAEFLDRYALHAASA
ncbi:MAG: hypothetical protein ACYDCQ_01150 [Dehalococcoidia bacterium]